MDIKERVHRCLILEEMKKNEKTANRLGLKDSSKISKQKPKKSH